jgi:hypothetical protein
MTTRCWRNGALALGRLGLPAAGRAQRRCGDAGRDGTGAAAAGRRHVAPGPAAAAVRAGWAAAGRGAPAAFPGEGGRGADRSLGAVEARLAEREQRLQAMQRDLAADRRMVEAWRGAGRGPLRQGRNGRSGGI